MLGLTNRRTSARSDRGRTLTENAPPASMSPRVTEPRSTDTATNLGTVATCIAQLQVIRLRCVAEPAPHHEETGGHRPEHPAAQAVVLLAVAALGKGPDVGRGDRHRSARFRSVQLPNGSSPAPLGWVVEVDGV